LRGGQSSGLNLLFGLFLRLFKQLVLCSFVFAGQLVDLVADVVGQRLADFLSDLVADLFPDFLGEAFQEAVQQSSADDEHDFNAGKALFVGRSEVANSGSDFGSDVHASGFEGWIHADLQK